MIIWGKGHSKSITTVIMSFVMALLTFLLVISTPEDVMAYDNVVVVIDPGHGGPGVVNESDLGAIYDNAYEKDIDLITAKALYEELSQYGNITVLLTRTEDTEMTLKDRALFAQSVGADILISVHYNASEFHRFYGTEIFTSAFDNFYARGYSMASNIMNWWNEAGGASKGIKVRIGSQGSDYYGLIREARALGVPAIILEHGYLDNPVDSERLSNEEAWKRMGVLDATAIADYYGLKKNMVQASIERPITVEVPSARVEPDVTPPENVSFTIDSYDNNTRMLSYTIYASDPEGTLMYYDLDTAERAEDLENGFMHLSTWKNGEDHMQGTYTVPEGYTGSFVARAYNTYELFTDSIPQAIPTDMLIPDAESAKAYLAGENGSGSQEGSNIQLLDPDTGEALVTDDGITVWNLDEVLEDGERSKFSFNHDDQKKQSIFNYTGMIVAFAVVGVAILAGLIIGVVVLASKGKKNKNKDKYYY